MIEDEEFINDVKTFGLEIKIKITPYFSLIKGLYDNVVIVRKLNNENRVHITNPNIITINESGKFEIFYENYLDAVERSFKCESFEQLKESLRTCLKELKEKKIKWEKDQLDKEFNEL